MINELPDLIRKTADERIRAIELSLITSIEIIEGRVPTNEEVATFGRRVTQQGVEGEWFTWRGERILKVEPLFPRLNGS